MSFQGLTVAAAYILLISLTSVVIKSLYAVPITCSVIPCKNDGICTQKAPDAVHCSCQPGYTGPFCENKTKTVWTPEASKECSSECEALGLTALISGYEPPDSIPLYVCAANLSSSRGYISGVKKHGVAMCRMGVNAGYTYRCLCDILVKWFIASKGEECTKTCCSPVFSGTYIYSLGHVLSEELMYVCRARAQGYTSSGYQINHHGGTCLANFKGTTLPVADKECLCSDPDAHQNCCDTDHLLAENGELNFTKIVSHDKAVEFKCSAGLVLVENKLKTTSTVQCNNSEWILPDGQLRCVKDLKTFCANQDGYFAIDRRTCTTRCFTAVTTTNAYFDNVAICKSKASISSRGRLAIFSVQSVYESVIAKLKPKLRGNSHFGLKTLVPGTVGLKDWYWYEDNNLVAPLTQFPGVLFGGETRFNGQHDATYGYYSYSYYHTGSNGWYDTHSGNLMGAICELISDPETNTCCNTDQLVVENGHLNLTGFALQGEVVDFKCNSGMVQRGAVEKNRSVAICSLNKKWMLPDGDLHCTGVCYAADLNLENAFINSTGHREVHIGELEVSCEPGHRINGNISADSITIPCINGSWSNDTVTCKAVCNTDELSVEEGQLNKTGLVFHHETIKFYCVGDLVMEANHFKKNSVVTCNGTNWLLSDGNLKCVKRQIEVLTTKTFQLRSGQLINEMMEELWGIRSPMECGARCLMKPGCVSFNFYKKCCKGNRGNCELNGKGRNGLESGRFLENDDVVYGEIVELELKDEL